MSNKDLKRLVDEKHDLIFELALKNSTKKKWCIGAPPDSKELNCLLTDGGHVVVFLTDEAEKEFYLGNYHKMYYDTAAGIHIQEPKDMMVFHRNYIQKKIKAGHLIIK